MTVPNEISSILSSTSTFHHRQLDEFAYGHTTVSEKGEGPMSAGDEIVGYEVAAVEEWIRDNTQGLEPPFEWTRLEGGHSNLTYSLKDQNGNAAVVRRPPMGELLPKAHDMGRSFPLSAALARPPFQCLSPMATVKAPTLPAPTSTL